MSYAQSFQQRSQKRINNRENRKRQLSINSQDMFSTKATVMIAMSMLEDVLANFFKDRKSEEEKLRDIIAKIEKARQEGKDLDKEILQDKNFQEALREIDPNNYDKNMKILKDIAENKNITLDGEKIDSLRAEFLLKDRNERDVSTQKQFNTQKSSQSPKKQRIQNG